MCPFPGCRKKLVVKCPIDADTGRIKLLDDDGKRQWKGRDAVILANHFQAPLTGHGREGVQMLIDADIDMGRGGRRDGLTGEAALKPRRATGRRDGLPGPARTIIASPEALARQGRIRADFRLNSMPVERTYGPLCCRRAR